MLIWDAGNVGNERGGAFSEEIFFVLLHENKKACITISRIHRIRFIDTLLDSLRVKYHCFLMESQGRFTQGCKECALCVLISNQDNFCNPTQVQDYLHSHFGMSQCV